MLPGTDGETATQVWTLLLSETTADQKTLHNECVDSHCAVAAPEILALPSTSFYLIIHFLCRFAKATSPRNADFSQVDC